MFNGTKVVLTLASLASLFLLACQSDPARLRPVSTASSKPAAGDDVVIHASSKRIAGPIQALLSNGDNALLLWQAYDDNSSAVMNQGKWLESSQAPFQFDADRPFTMHALMHGVKNEGLVVWNELSSDDIGFGNPKALYSMRLNTAGTYAPTRVGSYTLHDLSLNEKGDGHMVVSNEKDSVSAQTQIYLIPVQSNTVQIKAIDDANVMKYAEQVKQQEAALPSVFTISGNFKGMDVVLAAKIQSTGDGLIIWRDLVDSVAVVKSIQVKNFKAISASEQVLPVNGESFRPPQGDVPQLVLKIENGNGYMAWPENNTLRLMRVENNQTQPETQSLPLPTNLTCTPLNGGLTAPAWHVKMDKDGNGVASWTDGKRQQMQIQRIQNFKFVSDPQILYSPEHLNICMTKVSPLKANDVWVAALSTSCPDNTCTASEEQEQVIWSQKVRLK
jgi:hypothetical protein